MRAGSSVASLNPLAVIGCFPALSQEPPFGQRQAPSGVVLQTLNTPKPRWANHRAARIRSSADGRAAWVVAIIRVVVIAWVSYLRTGDHLRVARLPARWQEPRRQPVDQRRRTGLPAAAG